MAQALRKNRRLGSGLASSIIVLAGLSLGQDSHANCARPVSYDLTVEESKVTVCPQNWESRACPDPGGMLRQDVATGKVLRIPDRCVKLGESKSCYLDSCVPAGKYRYGFAVPYKCYKSSCNTDYYEEVEVKRATRCNPGDDQPATPFAKGAPWSDRRAICTYGGCSFGTGTSAMVFGVQGLVVLIGLVLWRRRRRR
jgi:hypothetical protein